MGVLFCVHFMSWKSDCGCYGPISHVCESSECWIVLPWPLQWKGLCSAPDYMTICRDPTTGLKPYSQHPASSGGGRWPLHLHCLQPAGLCALNSRHPRHWWDTQIHNRNSETSSLLTHSICTARNFNQSPLTLHRWRPVHTMAIKSKLLTAEVIVWPRWIIQYVCSRLLQG